jgi:hypothetical protein
MAAVPAGGRALTTGGEPQLLQQQLGGGVVADQHHLADHLGDGGRLERRDLGGAVRSVPRRCLAADAHASLFEQCTAKVAAASTGGSPGWRDEAGWSGWSTSTRSSRR